jgi:large subunit ribosomal protein L3
MQGLIGRKIGMTRLFDKETGEIVPVSVIETGTNVVHQIKTTEKEGYSAAQLGFGARSEKRVSKPALGHFKKLGTSATRVVKEFKLDPEDTELKSGQRIGVEVFENIKFVDVTGTSKGHGFTGTIKKYNFKRGRMTHGNTNRRERGSSGSNTYPARVFPGLKMAGQDGNEQVTARNLRLVGTDKDAGLLLVRGAIPGPSKGYVFVKKSPGKNTAKKDQ